MKTQNDGRWGWDLEKYRIIWSDSYVQMTFIRRSSNFRTIAHPHGKQRNGMGWDIGCIESIWFYFCTRFNVSRYSSSSTSIFLFFFCYISSSSFKTEDNANKKFTNSPSCQYKFIETIITTEKYTIQLTLTSSLSHTLALEQASTRLKQLSSK